MRRKLSLPYLGGVLILVFIIVILPLMTNTKVQTIDTVQAVPYSKKEFIEMVAPDIQKVAKSYGIKPSVMIAKAVIDSQSGTTLLAEKYHNLYGVKASGRESFILMKSKDGQEKLKYKVYKSWKESIYDYFSKIKDGSVGEKKYYVTLISQKNYKNMASVIEAKNGDGSKTYAKQLIQTVVAYNLTKYDK